MNRKPSWPITVLSVFALLPLSGCATNRLSYGHFCQIKVGTSTKEDVHQLLGEPNAKLGAQWMYEVPQRHLHAFVDFNHGQRVSRMQWIEAEQGIWEDSAGNTEPPGGTR